MKSNAPKLDSWCRLIDTRCKLTLCRHYLGMITHDYHIELGPVLSDGLHTITNLLGEVSEFVAAIDDESPFELKPVKWDTGAVMQVEEQDEKEVQP